MRGELSPDGVSEAIRDHLNKPVETFKWIVGYCNLKQLEAVIEAAEVGVESHEFVEGYYAALDELKNYIIDTTNQGRSEQ